VTGRASENWAAGAANALRVFDALRFRPLGSIGGLAEHALYLLSTLSKNTQCDE
jgi:hypothetical protein